MFLKKVFCNSWCIAEPPEERTDIQENVINHGQNILIKLWLEKTHKYIAYYPIPPGSQSLLQAVHLYWKHSLYSLICSLYFPHYQYFLVHFPIILKSLLIFLNLTSLPLVREPQTHLILFHILSKGSLDLNIIPLHVKCITEIWQQRLICIFSHCFISLSAYLDFRLHDIWHHIPPLCFWNILGIHSSSAPVS